MGSGEETSLQEESRGCLRSELTRAQAFTVSIKGPLLHHHVWCDVYPLHI